MFAITETSLIYGTFAGVHFNDAAEWFIKSLDRTDES